MVDIPISDLTEIRETDEDEKRAYMSLMGLHVRFVGRTADLQYVPMPDSARMTYDPAEKDLSSSQ